MAQIPLPSLLLDDKNPRLHSGGHARSQLEILRELALGDEHADKILVLSRDIAHHGLDPSSLVCVYKSEPQAKQYVVLEGNRRIASLKLLLNPELILGLADTGRYKEIKKLSEFFTLPPLINCIVFETLEHADHWIGLKHTGQHGGAGMVPWGSIETLRFSHRNSEKPLELQILDFAVSHIDSFDPSFVKITNLERLISDPYVRDALGIRIIKSVIYVDRNLKNFAELLKAFFEEITEENFTVNKIKTKIDRRRFIEGFLERTKHISRRLTDSDEIYSLTGKRQISTDKRLNHKAAKTVVRVALHKTVLTHIATDERYSNRTKVLAKELKEFGFEKSPVGSILLMKAFLESLVSESGFTNSEGMNLRSSLKFLSQNATSENNILVSRSVEVILNSPIMNKKEFDVLLNLLRSDRIGYMNNILSAVGTLVSYFNAPSKSFDDVKQ